MIEVSSSRDREDDLALNVPTGGSFVRLASVRKRKRAVYGDANRPSIEQASEFCQLRAVRAHLGHRHRYPQFCGLLGSLACVGVRERFRPTYALRQSDSLALPFTDQVALKLRKGAHDTV